MQLQILTVPPRPTAIINTCVHIDTTSVANGQPGNVSNMQRQGEEKGVGRDRKGVGGQREGRRVREQEREGGRGGGRERERGGGGREREGERERELELKNFNSKGQ